MKITVKITVILLVIFLGWRCSEDPIIPEEPELELYEFPDILNFSDMPANPENPATKVGVALGRKLFFDPILSANNTVSCATCHDPSKAFASSFAVTPGVDGALGRRNAPPLINLAWFKAFNWDGKETKVRNQNIHPVPSVVEMALPWATAVERIKADTAYAAAFATAFPDEDITEFTITKALEQFQMTLISYNSPFDKYVREEAPLSTAALRGFEIFRTEKGDCFHCHSESNSPELFVTTRLIFTNNGLDTVETLNDFLDFGRGDITGDENDNGKFKIPTLRNLAYTAPYMHDGRFNTLDEVINMYDKGVAPSPNVDPLFLADAEKRLEELGHWGLNLTPQEKSDLKAFLLSLSDEEFITNPEFQEP
jgi:cytochrome c peroxidase